MSWIGPAIGAGASFLGSKKQSDAMEEMANKKSQDFLMPQQQAMYPALYEAIQQLANAGPAVFPGQLSVGRQSPSYLSSPTKLDINFPTSSSGPSGGILERFAGHLRERTGDEAPGPFSPGGGGDPEPPVTEPEGGWGPGWHPGAAGHDPDDPAYPGNTAAPASASPSLPSYFSYTPSTPSSVLPGLPATLQPKAEPKDRKEPKEKPEKIYEGKIVNTDKPRTSTSKRIMA